MSDQVRWSVIGCTSTVLKQHSGVTFWCAPIFQCTQEMYRWNTHLYMPLGLNSTRFSIYYAITGGIQEWYKCIHLHRWGGKWECYTGVAYIFLCCRMISQLFNCYFWNYFSMHVYMYLWVHFFEFCDLNHEWHYHNLGFLTWWELVRSCPADWDQSSRLFDRKKITELYQLQIAEESRTLTTMSLKSKTKLQSATLNSPLIKMKRPLLL